MSDAGWLKKTEDGRPETEEGSPERISDDCAVGTVLYKKEFVSSKIKT